MSQTGARLCTFVMREYGNRLTTKQLRGPWTYIGTYSGEISGVVIPADGTRTGYRVMLADMELQREDPSSGNLDFGN